MSSTLPDQIDPAARYLFYLHGQIVEDRGDGALHPRFGVYTYGDILNALAAHDLVVIGEVRPAGTVVEAYARKVAEQVRRLLAAGVPPGHVTVAGHSKGGAIAVHISALLGNPELRFALLACCGGWMEGADAPRLSGQILSMYDAGDTVAGSCGAALARAAAGSSGHEVVLELGQGHGLFYRPQAAWVDPLVAWVRSSS